MDSFFKASNPQLACSWADYCDGKILLLHFSFSSSQSNLATQIIPLFCEELFCQVLFCNSFGVASLSALCTARHQSHPFLRNMPWVTHEIAPTYFVFVFERVNFCLVCQTLWQTVWAVQWQHSKNTSLLVVFPAPPLLISLSGISGCFLRGWFVRGRNLENQQRAVAAWQPLDPAHCALMHPMNIRTILEEVAFRKQSNVELFLVCGDCFLLVSALYHILMHPIGLMAMQRRRRGVPFCVGEFFKWFEKNRISYF